MTKIIKSSGHSADLVEYAQILHEIKKSIQQSQTKALLAVNSELLKMYWNIGKIIAEQQELHGWGSNLVENLAQDLQSAFPGMGGFSRANMFYIRSFYVKYAKVQQAVGLLYDLAIFSIPWGQNVVLLTKIEDVQECLWYAEQTVEHGWSRTVLQWQISSKLYHRQGKAISNFKYVLPANESDLVQQAFKDPYILDFISLTEPYVERDIEKGLMTNIRQVMLEFGKGFAFMGQQYHVKVGAQDFYIDLLFYHVPLKRYVVIELKARDFSHLDAGQIAFYITAIDEQLKGPGDNSTIGLVLCKDKDHFVADYALKNINIPIGVASYEIDLIKELPLEFKSSLPSIQEIERELEKHDILQELVIQDDVAKHSKVKKK